MTTPYRHPKGCREILFRLVLDERWEFIPFVFPVLVAGGDDRVSIVKRILKIEMTGCVAHVHNTPPLFLQAGIGELHTADFCLQ